MQKNMLSIAITAVLFAVVSAPSDAWAVAQPCLKNAADQGQKTVLKERLKQARQPDKKDLAKDYQQPQVPHMLLNSNGNNSDVFKNYFPEAQPANDQFANMIPQFANQMQQQQPTDPNKIVQGGGGGGCTDPDPTQEYKWNQKE